VRPANADSSETGSLKSPNRTSAPRSAKCATLAGPADENQLLWTDVVPVEQDLDDPAAEVARCSGHSDAHEVLQFVITIILPL